MRKISEIIEVIDCLRFRARKGFIGRYESELCIGALNWVLKQDGIHTRWFEYRVGQDTLKQKIEEIINSHIVVDREKCPFNTNGYCDLEEVKKHKYCRCNSNYNCFFVDNEKARLKIEKIKEVLNND